MKSPTLLAASLIWAPVREMHEVIDDPLLSPRDRAETALTLAANRYALDGLAAGIEHGPDDGARGHALLGIGGCRKGQGCRQRQQQGGESSASHVG